MRQFLANAGSIAMTRKHLGFIREHTQMAQAVDDSEHTATREIGTADRTLEEGIAGKRNMLSLAIESDGTVAVTRSLNNLELMAAELDDFVFLEEMIDRRELRIQLHLIEGLCLMSQPLHQLLIALSHFRLQAKLLIDGVVAEVVVKMAMGNEQMNRLQFVLTDILGDGIALFRIERSTVDDDAFLVSSLTT